VRVTNVIQGAGSIEGFRERAGFRRSLLWLFKRRKNREKARVLGLGTEEMEFDLGLVTKSEQTLEIGGTRLRPILQAFAMFDWRLSLRDKECGVFGFRNTFSAMTNFKDKRL
jgi:hypothetical protein